MSKTTTAIRGGRVIHIDNSARHTEATLNKHKAAEAVIPGSFRRTLTLFIKALGMRIGQEIGTTWDQVPSRNPKGYLIAFVIGNEGQKGFKMYFSPDMKQILKVAVYAKGILNPNGKKSFEFDTKKYKITTVIAGLHAIFIDLMRGGSGKVNIKNAIASLAKAKAGGVSMKGMGADELDSALAEIDPEDFQRVQMERPNYVAVSAEERTLFEDLGQTEEDAVNGVINPITAAKRLEELDITVETVVGPNRKPAACLIAGGTGTGKTEFVRESLRKHGFRELSYERSLKTPIVGKSADAGDAPAPPIPNGLPTENEGLYNEAFPGEGEAVVDTENPFAAIWNGADTQKDHGADMPEKDNKRVVGAASEDLHAVSAREVEGDLPFDKRYVEITGKISTAALFSLIYHNRNRVIILDDVDIFDDEDKAQLLKGWLSMKGVGASLSSQVMTGPTGEKLPREVRFQGVLIIITNNKLSKMLKHPHFGAVLSRNPFVDMSLNQAELFELMIAKNDKMCATYGLDEKAGLRFIAYLKVLANSGRVDFGNPINLHMFNVGLKDLRNAPAHVDTLSIFENFSRRMYSAEMDKEISDDKAGRRRV